MIHARGGGARPALHQADSAMGSTAETAIAGTPLAACRETGGMTTGTERAGLSASSSSRRAFWSQRLRDYVTLTKPRIISLLLVTTIAPMFLAAGGWPGGRAVLLTMIGGYLMAGGANAINMYLDRDIDSHMGRTKLRPIPSGRMSPRHGLVFGLTLAT